MYKIRNKINVTSIFVQLASSIAIARSNWDGTRWSRIEFHAWIRHRAHFFARGIMSDIKDTLSTLCGYINSL